MLFAAVVGLLIASAAGMERLRTVYPVIMEERSGDAPLILRIHHGLTLSLTKASIASEMVRLRSYVNGTSIDKMVKASEIEETLFEDKTKLATVSLVMGPDGVRVTGLLSPTEKIEPTMHGARSVSGGLPHIVRSIQRPLGSKRVMFESRKDKGPLKCTDKTMPTNVTVEVYVVSDYQHNRRFEESDFLIYICIFMNSLNAIFVSLSCPDVRLILVGAERTDKYQESNYVFGNDKLMNDLTSLDLFRKYALAKKADYGYPDITLLLTGRDLYESTRRGSPDRRVAGIAYEGAICTDGSVAMTEDVPGSYSGVIDAAHELGHSMGASHDGSAPNANLGNHPGSLDCPYNSGHIMTYVDGGALRYRFSECNKEEIRFVLRLRGKSCWDIKANQSYTVKGVYPGALLTPQQYCRMRYKNNNMYSLMGEPLMSHCKMRCCMAFTSMNHKCALHHMLDYMRCGAKKVCFQGVCRQERDLRNRMTYSNRKRT